MICLEFTSPFFVNTGILGMYLGTYIVTIYLSVRAILDIYVSNLFLTLERCRLEAKNANDCLFKNSKLSTRISSLTDKCLDPPCVKNRSRN
jgi:hypothetical protein